MSIDHLCRWKRCVNPVHLEPVPYEENTRRKVPTARTALDTRPIPVVIGQPVGRVHVAGSGGVRALPRVLAVCDQHPLVNLERVWLSQIAVTQPVILDPAKFVGAVIQPFVRPEGVE
jgi:hypothetical protein